MDLLLTIYLITPGRDPDKADWCMNNMCTFLDVTQSVPGCDYAYSKGECITLGSGVYQVFTKNGMLTVICHMFWSKFIKQYGSLFRIVK